MTLIHTSASPMSMSMSMSSSVTRLPPVAVGTRADDERRHWRVERIALCVASALLLLAFSSPRCFGWAAFAEIGEPLVGFALFIPLIALLFTIAAVTDRRVVHVLCVVAAPCALPWIAIATLLSGIEPPINESLWQEGLAMLVAVAVGALACVVAFFRARAR